MDKLYLAAILAVVILFSGCVIPSGPKAFTEQQSKEIAELFVKNLSQYKELGISSPALLNSTSGAFPYSWTFVYQFDMNSTFIPGAKDLATVSVTVKEGLVTESNFKQGAATFNETFGEKSCEVDSDCACGRHAQSGECFFGNKDFVDVGQQCPDFCTGIDGKMKIYCEEYSCRQIHCAGCPLYSPPAPGWCENGTIVENPPNACGCYGPPSCDSTKSGNGTILFEKNSGWGPCPSDGPCYQSTKLYYSGKLVMEGSTELQKQLSPDEMNELIRTIRATGIMGKECPASTIMDYSATYKLNINNQEKTIEFPGCEFDLLEIEKVIPAEWI